jgi:cysteinyl-tRNA synthetase
LTLRVPGGEIERLMDGVRMGFTDAMDDDLNIGSALAALFEFVRDINNLIDAYRVGRQEARLVHDLMLEFDQVLGLLGKIRKEELPEEIEELVLRREDTRKAKDWRTADEIREQLKNMG